MSNIVLDGIMGLVVGDALGVPVEFQSRDSLEKEPVTGMRAYGTYGQPAGTWSDDSSLTLALLDSLKKGLDYKDIMDKFLGWYERADYTPHGQMFDIGNATSAALRRYKSGCAPLEAGGTSKGDNGNGSLMRILPILFYLLKHYGEDFTEKAEAFEIIHNISALTHGHRRSMMACGIYICLAKSLIGLKDKERAVKEGLKTAFAYYKNQADFKNEEQHFITLEDEDFKNLPEDDIESGGYVVDSLKASLWCLLNTGSYADCVLKAVNLGKDTDTTAAIAGGLAGLFYGYEAIPEDWLGVISRREYVEALCEF